jgi:uncharacterized protein (DUF305 family)
VTLAFVVVLGAIGACQGSPSENAQDRAFVVAMVPHHELGMRMLDTAARRADDVRLRRMVFEMSSYHDHELDELRVDLNAWGLAKITDFPGVISAERLLALDELSGAEHDVSWLRVMIEHHEGAMVIAHSQVKTGSKPSLISLAEQTIEVQSQELVEMRQLVDEICGEQQVSSCASSAP